MKKILFFLSSIFLLSACSNDNDPINSGNIDDIKYLVTLNIETPKISIETSNLRNSSSAAEGEPIIYEYIIYKENGEVYIEGFHVIKEFGSSNNNVNDIFSITGTNLTAQLSLSAGNYHIAMLVYRNESTYPISDMSIIIANNYETDNTSPLTANGQIYANKVHNGGAYFNTADLTVVASQTDQNLSMELQPMWSYIDVNIEDAQTFDVPEGTNALQFVVNPLYYGINVKSKLAPFEDNRPIIFSLDSIRTSATFNLRTTVSKSVADNTISAKINYLNIDGDTTVLDTRQLSLPNSNLENGYYYNIHGSLGTRSTGQSMNISLGEFNKEDVNIEF